MVPETYIKGISTRSIDDLVKTAADPAPHNADHLATGIHDQAV